jgi:hypothetical protein
VANRDATRKVSAHLGDEEGRGHPIGRHLQSAAELLELVEVGGPRLGAPPIGEKLESLGFELLVRGNCVRLIVGAQRAQPQIGG